MPKKLTLFSLYMGGVKMGAVFVGEDHGKIILVNPPPLLRVVACLSASLVD